ncbi:MAG: hypothetical protein Q7S79_01025 [bacterium]|nr:hypothetical protein [bacterium]
MGEPNESLRRNEASPFWEGEVERQILELLPGYPDFAPLNFSLTSLGMAEIAYPELPENKQNSFRKLFFQAIGHDPENPKPAPDPDNPEKPLAYQVNAPEPVPGVGEPSWSGVANVQVFKGGQVNEEDIYLHIMTYPDGQEDFFLAPEDFRL